MRNLQWQNIISEEETKTLRQKSWYYSKKHRLGDQVLKNTNYEDVKKELK